MLMIKLPLWITDKYGYTIYTHLAIINYQQEFHPANEIADEILIKLKNNFPDNMDKFHNSSSDEKFYVMMKQCIECEMSDGKYIYSKKAVKKVN